MCTAPCQCIAGAIRQLAQVLEDRFSACCVFKPCVKLLMLGSDNKRCSGTSLTLVRAVR
jgi:hypothetical protein